MKLLIALVMASFLALTNCSFAETKTPPQVKIDSFKELVGHIRLGNVKAWTNEPQKFEHIRELGQKAGFNALMQDINMLIQFDEKTNDVNMYVIIQPERMIFQRKGDNEKILVSMEDAIAEIYGINQL